MAKNVLIINLFEKLANMKYYAGLQWFFKLGQQQTSPMTPEVCQSACMRTCGHADTRDLCLLQAACLP